MSKTKIEFTLFIEQDQEVENEQANKLLLQLVKNAKKQLKVYDFYYDVERY